MGRYGWDYSSSNRNNNSRYYDNEDDDYQDDDDDIFSPMAVKSSSSSNIHRSCDHRGEYEHVDTSNNTSSSNSYSNGSNKYRWVFLALSLALIYVVVPSPDTELQQQSHQNHQQQQSLDREWRNTNTSATAAVSDVGNENQILLLNSSSFEETVPMLSEPALPLTIKGTAAIATDGDGSAFAAAGAVEYPMPSSTAISQALNFRRGSGFLVNVHITHHGGTTFCNIIGHAANVTAPGFNCMYSEDDAAEMIQQDQDQSPQSLPVRPWTAAETAGNIALLRPHFDLVSWEFAHAPDASNPERPLSATAWEDPNLVSVIIMRDPIDRLLAGSGYVNRHFPKEDLRTHEQWWEFARNDRVTNNYALRVLAGDGCCAGEDTSIRHYRAAQKVVERFTFVLDIACLDEGLVALADVLGLALDPHQQRKSERKKRKAERGTARERIGHDNEDVYDFLVRRNHYDIQLYEWSKTRSLVDCSSLE